MLDEVVTLMLILPNKMLVHIITESLLSHYVLNICMRFVLV